MSQNVIRLLKNGDPETGMGASDMTGDEAFTTDDRTETNHTFFATGDEKILSGVWTCTPSREDFLESGYPVHEMMTVLGGSVTLTNADGSAETFAEGDTFFIAKGTKCVWEITTTLHKFYMIADV